MIGWASWLSAELAMSGNALNAKTPGYVSEMTPGNDYRLLLALSYDDRL